MASIQRVGKAWRVRYHQEGRGRSRKCPTRSVAEALKREIESAHALGRPWEPAEAREVPDLEVAAADYVRSCALRHAGSTVLHTAGRLEIWLKWLRGTDPGRRSWTVEVLSSGMLERYYAFLVSTKSGRHNRLRERGTAYKYVNTVELFWKWLGDRDEYADSVPRLRRWTSQVARVPARDVVAPTWEQMASCVVELDGWHRKLGTLLYYTGLRVQQVMGLTWADLDLDAMTLHVRGDLGKSAAERAGRLIPVSPHLIEELRTWSRGEVWLVETGPLTCDRDRAARGQDLGDAWARAGVPENVWRRRPHHTFRSGVQTGLASAGAKWEAVEILLGHTLPGSGNLYLHRNQMPLREAVALIPRLEIPAHRAPGWNAAPVLTAEETWVLRRARGHVGVLDLAELERLDAREVPADVAAALGVSTSWEWWALEQLGDASPGVVHTIRGAASRRLLKLRKAVKPRAAGGAR